MTEPRALSARPTAAHLPGRADQISRAREFTKRVLGPCPVTDEAVLLVSDNRPAETPEPGPLDPEPETGRVLSWSN